MNNSILGAVPDTDLEIKGGGGGGGEAWSPKNFFWPFGPRFGLKIRGGGRGSPGPSPGSVTEEISVLFNLSCMCFTDSNNSWCIFEFLL